MEAKLTFRAKKYLYDFLESADRIKTSPIYSYLFSFALLLLGLLLFGTAAIMTLNNPTDSIIYWVLVPGAVGGIITILCGAYLLDYLRKSEERKKIAKIIKRMLDT